MAKKRKDARRMHFGYVPIYSIIHYENKNFTWDLDLAKNYSGTWVWVTTTIRAEGGIRKSTRETWVNPYRHLKYYIARIKWHVTHLYLWLTKQLHRQCQGCGEGISVWRIKDPNNKFESDERIFVCDGCVNFYDWHWSRKPAVIKARRCKNGKKKKKRNKS